MSTLSGQMRHLERALIVAFYRGAERLRIERPVARQAVERADRFLQRLGVAYLVLAAAVTAAWLIVDVWGLA